VERVEGSFEYDHDISLEQSAGQGGKLKIHVSPKQAYVLVDGDAIRDGKQTVAPGAGKHAVYNYGRAHSLAAPDGARKGSSSCALRS
jgi:hypothetical protein